MSRADKAIRQYYRTVNEENAKLQQRWRQIVHHLDNGLAAPFNGSQRLRTIYRPPSVYVDASNRKRRKPVSWLYGPGKSAKERYVTDQQQYNDYCAKIKAETETANGTLDFWLAAAQAGEPDAVNWYSKAVLIPNLFSAPGCLGYVTYGYHQQERHLVLEQEAPPFAVVPDVVRYEIGRDLKLRPVTTSAQDRTRAYQSLLAQIALLTLDRTFRSEIAGIIDTASINAKTGMINPRTGHGDTVYVLSASIPKDRFIGLNLLRVDPIACFEAMNGRITHQPGEYAPVQPWVQATQYGMATVLARDIPLLSMDPFEFEHLVTELLTRMGLRAETTQRSHDNGVDCVAYDGRPVTGGKVVVQVKRYAHTVPPTVVRDLFGTVHASGAMKGVLITTSGFGPESKGFAEGKPLELIDGIYLNALLQQYGLTADPEEVQHAELIRQASALVSPDGQFFWDGSTWLPIAEAQAAVTPSDNALRQSGGGDPPTNG